MGLFSFSNSKKEDEIQVPSPQDMKEEVQEESHGLMDTFHQANESMKETMHNVHLFEGVGKSRQEDPNSDDMDDFVNLLG
ncbi:uncharacterized protein SPAPADRAFT_60932 [Spathaspora passalidarum NRRL Y-27907]|uniref:Uncharacterized protein n=1 Tax=Spathaspora passalidarum (strain NRRL Y-27907 / 11-Y1) TaxID=619300 RepID=G3AKI8_SPAPN|nr:uncharacterized protein SPAPADRAFT_60932 [Spathaspora passalidarum NRRL Y-27907]EGW33593.1 hypothetical protein SPAPADRAFT_60932 [Spathaspora passalidarum NRRL Y-27907]